MSFLTPIFLLGAAAAALPVLVHLVRRTRARRVEFASLMFLRRIEQKTVRKRKLRNLLLLALRSAALLLLALAFARPYFLSQSAAAGANGPARVVLLDLSYSMQYSDSFDRARRLATEAIEDAAADEQIALVAFGQSYEILAPLKANRVEALARLDQARPGLGSTDYLQALQAADALLKEAGGRPKKIFLVSDFQQSGWNRSAPPLKISPDIELIARDAAVPGGQNIAVTGVRADPVVYAQKYAGKVVARASQFGSTDQGVDAVVEFKLNDLAVERRQVRLGPGANEAVEFSGFNLAEGVSRATVEISGDNFALDNRFFFTIRREDQTRVLAIETAARGRSESFFLQQSLAAGENNQHALTVKTAGTVDPSELNSYSIVIVNDAAGISEPLAAALKSFAEGGGGLVLVAGRHTEGDGFNRSFEGVSPGRLTERVQARGYALMSQVQTQHPIFSLFARSGRLTSTRVYGYHRSTALEGASVIAALDDGSPVIIEKSAGRGKVLLVTTTLDTSWNDLPLTPMFLPLVRQMLEHLGGRKNVPAYTIGQTLAAAPDADGSLPAVDGPSGGRLDDGRKNPAGELALAANEIGFYRLRYRDRTEHLAVNLDTRESDLAKLNTDELIASVTASAADPASSEARSERLTPEEIEGKQRLWLPLLILSLALFAAEALLAGRIRIAKLIGH